MKKVEDIYLKKGKRVGELVEDFEKIGGFMAKHVAKGEEILEKMIKDKECFRIISFPACIVATGLRGIIRDMIKFKWFDLVITTCGTLDHDLARTFKDYYHGEFLANDLELRKEGINRLGNVFVPDESYGLIIEEKMKEILSEMYEEGMRNLGTYELCWEIGKRLNESSILFWAWKNQIPIIIPGITDGAVGSQLLFFREKKPDFNVDILKDEKLLSSLIWKKKKLGALIIGGGISKHHTIWWAQFRGGLDYAIYITTAIEWDGSLSGARPEEAISWKKIKEKADYVMIWGDATLILPIIANSLIEKV